MVDNTKKGKPEKKGDKDFKAKPLLEATTVNCNKIEPVGNHSMDE